MDIAELRSTAHAVGSRSNSIDGYLYDILQTKFPIEFLRKVMKVTQVNKNAAKRAARSLAIEAQTSAEISNLQTIIDSWPSVPTEEYILKCCSDYVKATTIQPPAPCVCCGRAFLLADLNDSFQLSLSDTHLPTDHPLQLLRADGAPRFAFISPVSIPTRILDGIMIHHEYITINPKTHSLSLLMCRECDSSLHSSQIPRFSLINNLYRGRLPPDLHDISWIEEKVCALHRVTADVARLHNAEQDEKLPFRLVGNTCAHPANVPSTADVLPRTPADVNGHLTVVFVGKKFDKKKLPPLFRVRRQVIEKFLRFLALHNPLYKDVKIDDQVLSLYPEDGILPGLSDSVIVSNPDNPASQLLQETASFDDHPAHLITEPSSTVPHYPIHPTTDDNSPVLIESTGVVDFSGSTISGHSSIANAVYNLLRPRHEGALPDLILPRGRDPIGEYDNPDLLPGMFPTLFPCGIGGLEADRPSRLSFQEHANYLLSLHHPAFKHHRLFLFVVLNILKRRKGHLHTSFTIKKPTFHRLAKTLTAVTAETLESTARHLQNNGSVSGMSSSQKEAFECLKQLNIVSANLPGSPGAKIRDRAQIRGYFGIFGLPHIYLTFNPSASHSPMMQVFLRDHQVDLSKQFPSMPLPDVRAKRIARDPVAAADFFVFSVKTFFRFMLGYDMDSKKSTGGILGHVKAYYGKCEVTNRGALHVHFVIWLLGGLNPREVHERLEADPAFSKRFFEFWEAIIKHDAPHEDLHVPEEFDPRPQRPPPINNEEWQSTFDWQVKACAEKLQRHDCQEVCWKYKNVSHLPKELRPCRFQFPHEIVPESYYDAASKSIVMVCRDPTMNFYNPYILVFCRHNHDIKNILSGKSAKAAMFYITNYITKDELHAHHILSMMSSTIAHMKELDDASLVDRAKARLQRWLSQLARLQEIHAQLAVLYIRGTGDTFFSHETIPMLSSILLARVRMVFPDVDTCQSKKPTSFDTNQASNPEPETNESDTYDADDSEEAYIPLRRGTNGVFYTDVTQIDDYLHRADDLQDMSFLEFVCCLRKEKKQARNQTRLGSYPRFPLKASHPQSTTHVLVQHQDPMLPLDLWRNPPRVIGMQVPRKDHAEYPLFMLAHFKPFSTTSPLISPTQSYSNAFHTFQFSSLARKIMQNWEDVHECEDERDAERMRKKQASTTTNAELNARLAAYNGANMEDEDFGPLIDLNTSSCHTNAAILQMVDTLKEAGWFASKNIDSLAPSTNNSISRPSCEKVKEWAKDMKEQEQNLRRERINKSDARTQVNYSSSLQAINSPSAFIYIPSNASHQNTTQHLPRTIAPRKNLPLETPEEVMIRIGHEMTLNNEQWTAYHIIARKFISDLIAHSDNQPRGPPIRLLLTGPGGTGKSHVVTTLKKLMTAYGAENRLRLLAPTGSTASVIDATTIHKGLGIEISRKKLNGTGDNGAVVSISKTKRLKLEEEWSDADYIFCDEVSMLGANLNAEFDQMLRLVKRNETWYGGVNIVFAGDLAQYPPVKATPLFHSIGPKSGSKTNRDFLARLGRLAWKSFDNVVELYVQNRMKGDPDYAAAVGRLRLRKCTPDDVEIFNSRVVRSPFNGNGVMLTVEESTSATTIVRDNKTRMYLNGLKASASSLREEVVMCAARDYQRNGNALEGAEQEAHLLHDFSSTISQGGLPSFIPLAVGMQVTLRQRNISTELKIANGSMGTIVQLFTSKNGPYISADGVVVHFPNSPLHLDDLPPGCIYIEPHSVSYQVKKGKNTEGFTRKQLQVEPAFAVTGHFSQGKTLPVVVADLRRGSYAAYVAASRPTSRNGLFLLHPVKLRDLNAPQLPNELLKEFHRLNLLRHNTLVRHGFLKADLKEVPDPEKEREILETEYDEPEDMPTRKRKRSRSEVDQEIGQPQSKQQRNRNIPPWTRAPLHPPTSSSSFPHPYLNWNSTDYSCPYDALLTPLYFAWTFLEDSHRHTLISYSWLLSQVLSGFESVNNAEAHSQQHSLHLVRENLRNALESSDHRHQFPRRGHAYAAVDELIHVLGLDTQQPIQLHYRCSSCSAIHHREENSEEHIHYVFYEASIACLADRYPNEVTVQEWIDAQLAAYHDARDQDRICPHCEAASQHTPVPLSSSPRPFIIFNIQPANHQLLPSLTFQIPQSASEAIWEYRLMAAIYYGSNHFTSRMISEGVCWDYDGMSGQPVFAGTVSTAPTSLAKLLDFQGRTATHFIYVLQNAASEA